MKLFVQGRKNGYNVLYPNPTPSEFFRFAGDIRPHGSNNSLLGKYFYTISLTNGGCIYTKHIIIHDVQRGGLGNIGFSVFIPYSCKLSGEQTIELLDVLINEYRVNYCPDYYLDNKAEDWTLFESIKTRYKPIDLANAESESYQGGSADPAYIYYHTQKDLHKYFDSPYQEEYNQYKQVLFFEKSHEGKPDNPLNAIPHDPNANLTGKIDLENPIYKLIYNQQSRDGLKIEVRVNGSLRYSKTKIKRKDELQIIWSKQFCEPRKQIGRWEDIGEKFLSVDPIQKTININEIPVHPIVHTLFIQTKDYLSNSIIGAEITLKLNNNLSERKVIGDTFQITEAELHSGCYVTAKKDNLISARKEIGYEDTNGPITLVLLEHKYVKIYVNDENGLINNYHLKIAGKDEVIGDSELLFKGPEISNTWQISVSKKGYDTLNFAYCPANGENPIYKTLEKRVADVLDPNPKKRYEIIIDEQKGKRSWRGVKLDEYKGQHPYTYGCDANYGYAFERWLKDADKSSKDSETYKAVFKELWYKKVPTLAWILFVISFGAFATAFIVGTVIQKNGESKTENFEINEIIGYVEGVELNLTTLNNYKRQYCESAYNIRGGVKEKSMFQKIWRWGFDDNNNPTNNSTLIKDVCSKIDNAIALRSAINIGDIDKLKKSELFSTTQQNLKNSIDSIEVKYRNPIRDSLNKSKISNLNLNEIAEFIRKTQQELRKKEANEHIQRESVENKPINQQDHTINVRLTDGKPSQGNLSRSPQESTGESLNTKFWTLVKSGNASMNAYRNLLGKHKNEGGDIINYLTEICKNSASFKKFKDIPEMDRKQARKLDDININSQR